MVHMAHRSSTVQPVLKISFLWTWIPTQKPPHFQSTPWASMPRRSFCKSGDSNFRPSRCLKFPWWLARNMLSQKQRQKGCEARVGLLIKNQQTMPTLARPFVPVAFQYVLSWSWSAARQNKRIEGKQYSRSKYAW